MNDSSRREFLGTALGVTAATLLPVAAHAAEAKKKKSADPAEAPKPKRTYDRRIKVGIVGCGGRGNMILDMFAEHGGFEIVAVADYFQDAVDKTGDRHKVPANRRYTGLKGYQRMIDAGGLEAIILKSLPYSLPEHIAGAAEAGLHVYMAKPIACDVPGTLLVRDSAAKLKGKQKQVLVDYQAPTLPDNQEVMRRILAGGIGKIAMLQTTGLTSTRPDRPLQDTIEDRLRGGAVWCNDNAIGAGYLINFDIHAIDLAVWAAQSAPIAAMGISRRDRTPAYGDSHDNTTVCLEYPGGILHNHLGIALNTQAKGALDCTIYGTEGHGFISYWGAPMMRSKNDRFIGVIDNQVYRNGPIRNIERFYDEILQNKIDHATVPRSVDGCLACILARDAALRGTRLTMAELLKENRRVEPSRKGLKA